MSYKVMYTNFKDNNKKSQIKEFALINNLITEILSKISMVHSTSTSLRYIKFI